MKFMQNHHSVIAVWSHSNFFNGQSFFQAQSLVRLNGNFAVGRRLAGLSSLAFGRHIHLVVTEFEMSNSSGKHPQSSKCPLLGSKWSSLGVVQTVRCHHRPKSTWQTLRESLVGETLCHKLFARFLERALFPSKFLVSIIKLLAWMWRQLIYDLINYEFCFTNWTSLETSSGGGLAA